MTRASIRTGIAQFFGGPTFDSVDRIYTGGALTANGLGCARAYYGKRAPDTDFFIGQPAGRNMGAVMHVHIPDEGPEQRIGMGGATAGIKWDPVQIQLWVYHLSQMTHAEDAGADLDQLIEAIRNRIHGDRTLGGVCTQAGETPQGRIRVQTPPPVLKAGKGAPERVEQYALITFGADVYITA